MAESIDSLIAERRYGEALPMLQSICRQQPRNTERRQQLAEVLTAVGDTGRAFKVLEGLVTDFARAGQHARAIAMVKRMQYIQPGRQDLDMKLAVLVKQAQQPAQSKTAASPTPSQTPRAHDEAEKQKVAAETRQPKSAPPKPVTGFVSKIDELISATSLGDRLLGESTGHHQTSDFLRGSKLLEGFNTHELEALIGRLQLTTVEPGEIIVAEGQPGASLFLIASGSVRVYVRNASGAQHQVRRMHHGDFFGEISLLKSAQRTATITAASRVELLELDRNAVNTIAAHHPQVWTIIEDFCIRRRGSIEEVGARARE